MEITETVLRFYVFLRHYLDRFHDQAAKEAFPESEFRKHLRVTQVKVTELLTSNRVVKQKVAAESNGILQLGSDSVERRSGVTGQLAKERELLRVKTVAISDLLAVFRSIET